MPGGSVYKGYTVNNEHSTPVSRKDDTYYEGNIKKSATYLDCLHGKIMQE
jgi:hypothetical protein